MFMCVDSLRLRVSSDKHQQKAGEYYKRPVLRIHDLKCPSMRTVYLVYSENTV